MGELRVSIYKECDIRGIYGKEFGDDDAYRIGRAVGSLMQGKNSASAAMSALRRQC